MSKINQLKEKMEFRLEACNLIAVFLVAVLCFLVFLLSNEAKAQTKPSVDSVILKTIEKKVQSTFNGEGVSTGKKETTIQKKLMTSISSYLRQSRLRLLFHNMDSVFMIRLQPLNMKVDTTFSNGVISLYSLDSLINTVNSNHKIDFKFVNNPFEILTNSLTRINSPDKKSKVNVFFISVLILLILLTAAGIRYFILLAVHYRSRADALSLIGDLEKLSVTDVIALTSASNIDFRISKHVKNELLEIFNLKAETKKAEEMSKVKCCCCPCNKVTEHKEK